MAHGQTKMPPSYEECQRMQLHQAQSMATGLQNSQQQQQQPESQQFYGMHPRQQSIPASMTYNPHMSPPIMSPPQSVQSAHSLSPPGVTSPQQMAHQTSPMKNRGMLLPTSPTHMAAMRGASHQRHQSFDFPETQTQQQMTHPGMMQPGMYPYLPTPPQNGEPSTNFMTPSPDSHQDSPGQWSSASPQSHSDWSEGLSPPANNYPNQIKQGQDGIFI